MLPSAAPGRIGLDADSVGYGRVVVPRLNWLMLTGTRRRSPCDPKYPIITPVAPNSRSTLTFQVCMRPGRKFGLVVVGARPDACAVASALSRRTAPATFSGTASGGFAPAPPM